MTPNERKRERKWHTAGYVPVVTNAQREYVPALEAALKHEGLSFVVLCAGRSPYRSWSIWVKDADHLRACDALHGLAYSWWSASHSRIAQCA